MPLQLSSSLVVGIGSTAEQIINRAQELIKLRTKCQNVPDIFQFLLVGGNEPDMGAKIAQAYSTVVNKRSILKAEESAGIKVRPSRVESYVIAPLHPDQQALTIQVARALKESSLETVGGGRNAVFLIPRVSPELARERRSSAEQIDAEIKHNLLFNRSFFIDEIDEFGYTIEEADLIELVARFISLAVASELANSIRLSPPPYFGDGAHFTGYGSFSCSNITFDRGSFIDSLSRYLLDDIRQRLFTNSGLETNKWSERAACWFADSLRSFSKPQNSDDSEPLLDKDFDSLKRELDVFTLDACHSLFRDVNAYSRVLDSLLERAEIELELHASRIKRIRKEIDELQIKILLGIGGGTPVSGPTHTTIKRNWALIGICGVLGLGGLIALLVITNGQLQQQKFPTLLASTLIVVSLILLRGQRETHPGVTPPPSNTWEEQLRKQMQFFKRQKKQENIHLALFTYLDLSLANLEDLRARRVEPNATTERNIFDIDLTSEELTKNFYAQHYETRETDIAAFTDGAHLDQLHRILFSHFEVKVFDHLMEFCKRCFEKTSGYDLEKALRLRESLDARWPALAVSSPLWHPVNTDADRVILALTSADNGMRTLLTNTFGDNKVQFFNTQDSCITTVIQIAYGQELRNILIDPLTKTAAQ